MIASVHSKLRMAGKEMTERMVRAVANPARGRARPLHRRMIGKLLTRPASTPTTSSPACAHFHTAVEINCRPERLDPPRDLLKMAIDYGCWFSIDSDAHSTGQLEWQPLGCNRAAEVGVPLDRVINTFTADRLLAWTRGDDGAQ